MDVMYLEADPLNHVSMRMATSMLPKPAEGNLDILPKGDWGTVSSKKNSGTARSCRVRQVIRPPLDFETVSGQ